MSRMDGRPDPLDGRARALLDARAPGLTIVELLVVVVISGFMLAAVVQTIVVQQRGHTRQQTVADTRQTLRTTVEVLLAELREISATDGDLLEAGPHRIRFRAFRRVGVICALASSSNQATIWYLGAEDEGFAKDDHVLVFADGDDTTGSDDIWLESAITESPSAGGCTGSWARIDDAGQEYTTQRLIFEHSLNGVIPGAPVRAFAPMTYGAWEFENGWAVGRAADGENPIELVGPIMPPEEGGLVFRYFDADGQQLSPTTAARRREVRRIEISVRGLGAPLADGSGESYTETLTTQVYLRGNARSAN